jgi:hypothetical protein
MSILDRHIVHYAKHKQCREKLEMSSAFTAEEDYRVVRKDTASYWQFDCKRDCTKLSMLDSQQLWGSRMRPKSNFTGVWKLSDLETERSSSGNICSRISSTISPSPGGVEVAIRRQRVLPPAPPPPVWNRSNRPYINRRNFTRSPTPDQIKLRSVVRRRSESPPAKKPRKH